MENPLTDKWNKLFLDQVPTFLTNEDKSKVVVLKADKSIDHGFVVQVMDIIKRSGFNKIGIAVKKFDQ